MPTQHPFLILRPDRLTLEWPTPNCRTFAVFSFEEFTATLTRTLGTTLVPNAGALEKIRLHILVCDSILETAVTLVGAAEDASLRHDDGDSA